MSHYNRSLTVITETDTRISILFILYILIVENSLDYNSLRLSVYALLTLILYFSFGFYINDFFDMQHDISAGKKRFVQSISKIHSIAIMSAMTIVAFIIVIFFIKDVNYFIFYSLAYLLGTFYSSPPLRFKEKVFSGPVVDMLIEKTAPLVLILVLFHYFKWDGLLFIFIFSFFQLYVILLHQLIDFDTDSSSGMSTFVTKIGKKKTEIIIKYMQPMLLIILFWVYLLAAYNIERLRIYVAMLIVFGIIVYAIFNKTESKIQPIYLNIIFLFTETLFPFLLGVYLTYMYNIYISLLLLFILSNYPYLLKVTSYIHKYSEKFKI